MTRRDNTIRLRHMLDHAREAVAMSLGRERGELDRDRQLMLSLLKLVEIIGEAAYRVTTDVREAHPSIPWDQIVGTRNRLVHGYDKVDLDVLWRIVSEDLPALIEQLQAVLDQSD
jgi:uncharacterized protein with HEPN domain